MVAVVGVCVAVVGIGFVFEGTGCRCRGQGRLFAGCCTDLGVCRDGCSPLWMASVGGHASCVEALIRGKADVLQCNKLVF